jgi:predicted DNA-binding transcriptional regulator AlpA
VALADVYVTIQQVAKGIKRSTKTVRRMVSDGRCPPPFRLNGGLCWRKSVIDEWMIRNAIMNEIDPSEIFDGTKLDKPGHSGTSEADAPNSPSNPKRPR